MKKFKQLAVLAILFSFTSLSAEDFDWSECWCNYGGGIEKGDLIINLDAGLYFTDFVYAAYNNFWFIPPVLLEVQFAQPIWKLPFTFGGYAGIRGHGYYYFGDETKFLEVFFGGEAAYHIRLPPEKLDVYVITRIGGNIPVIRPTGIWVPEYFHVGEGIGANWYFGKNFGLNFELGYPFTKVGVTLKF